MLSDRSLLIGQKLVENAKNSNATFWVIFKHEFRFLGPINSFSWQIMDKIIGPQITNEILSQIPSNRHVDIQSIDNLQYCHFRVYLTKPN